MLTCPDCHASLTTRSCPCGWRERIYECPEFGDVRREDLPIAEAVVAVTQANIAQYGAANYFSPSEADLLAAFWWYGLTPGLQATISRVRLDFWFPRYSLAVEVDGRTHEAARDERRDHWLVSRHNIYTHRVTARDVFYDPLYEARCVRELQQRFNRRRQRIAVPPALLDPGRSPCFWPHTPLVPLLGEYLARQEEHAR